MTRRKAREYVLCMLYETMFHEVEERKRIFEEFETKENLAEKETPQMIAFIKTLYFGTLEHLDDLDEAIKASATNWSLERISKIDLTILRMTLFELKYTDIPQKVAVNEALEIAKRYSTEKAPKFINGVLGSMIRKQNEAIV